MDLTPNINKQKGTYGMTFLNCDFINFINFNDVSIEYVLPKVNFLASSR